MAADADIPFFDVRVDRTAHTVLLVRTSRPYASAADIICSFRDVEDEIADLPRPGYVLVIDLRAAVGRNDPEFERVIEGPRTALMKDFARTVLIVRNTIGRLHVERHARESGLATVVAFTDDNEAHAFARHHAALPEVRSKLASAVKRGGGG